MTHLKLAVIAAALALGAGASQATVTTYTGSDDGASTSGPWTNSSAAAASFASAASAYGTVQTATFEGLPTGYQTSFAASPSLSVSLNAPDLSGFSGVLDSNSGNLYGFDTTAGGSEWLGFPAGSATLTVAGGTNAIGFYLTGVQTVFTADITVAFDDGTSQVLQAPVNNKGGVSYFGFTDTKAFSSITLTDTSYDAWGIDDVSFATTSAVPEPANLTLMALGLAAVGALARRRAGRDRA